MAESDWTVRRLLEWTTPFFTRKDVDSPRLSAERLLAHVLQCPRIKLYMDFDRVLGETQLGEYRDLIRRAGEQEPVEYLTGRAHFFNLEFQVTRDVLIPRPDTEVLVEDAIRLARAKADWPSPRILDLCSGTGCVAAAIAANIKTASVIAVEISGPAAAVMRKNIENLKLTDRVRCLEGDLFGPLASREPFHVIVANPPYIRSAQMAELDKSVRDYEPAGALDGGADGLDIHRRIWAEAAAYLSAGGEILLEIAYDQGPAAVAAMAAYPGLSAPRILKDYGGRDRVIAARKT